MYIHPTILFALLSTAIGSLATPLERTEKEDNHLIVSYPKNTRLSYGEYRKVGPHQITFDFEPDAISGSSTHFNYEKFEYEILSNDDNTVFYTLTVSLCLGRNFPAILPVWQALSSEGFIRWVVHTCLIALQCYAKVFKEFGGTEKWVLTKDSASAADNATKSNNVDISCPLHETECTYEYNCGDKPGWGK
ncbi:hypothetical protein I302_101718 [Kwoniella bestiolae CBS 10118]|uniref:Uncharacterized protein n=1 Tax=Kwoniella bestiolae CBS 10118 TaxID=1296100 RepID=A0A1B9GD09_9TREE|nr:hypothetical protein I302_00394 [Kwoniella bestiolae CBS 10118]OCF28904.1 hypothetical protein I302_00394 [Kwoniella bestiolae CBS 10118]